MKTHGTVDLFVDANKHVSVKQYNKFIGLFIEDGDSGTSGSSHGSGVPSEYISSDRWAAMLGF